MNRIFLHKLLYVGLLFMLTACQPGAWPPDIQKLKPGDMLNGMSLSTGATDAAPLWAFCSPAQQNGNATTSRCNVPLVSKLGIGHVFMLANNTLTKLDWSELTWELSIDEQAIDLERFGTYTFVLPTMPPRPSPIREVFKKFTAWDLVLMNLVSGEHTLRGLAQTETDTYIWVVSLTIEASD